MNGAVDPAQGMKAYGQISTCLNVLRMRGEDSTIRAFGPFDIFGMLMGESFVIASPVVVGLKRKCAPDGA